MNKDLTFEEFMVLAMRSRNNEFDSDLSQSLGMGGLGISGEAGEVADHIKKVLYHGHELDKEHIKKELGDVLWYFSYICYITGIAPSEVARANIEKLNARYPEGFSIERSINRTEGS